MKIKLGVLFGGVSVEHEISIITALQAMKHFDQEKYEIIPIYIDKDRIWYTGKLLMEIENYQNMDVLKKMAKKVIMYKKKDCYVLQTTDLLSRVVSEIDLVFPIMHGNNAEDGTIQGFLETLGIPYVGSKVLGGALGQDKVVMKQVMSSENLPIVSYTWFYDSEYLEKKEAILKDIEKLEYPVIVKPATLGSSVGIKVVKKKKDIDKAIMEAIKYDQKIIVEKVVEDLIEVNCSVIGNYNNQETSVIEEVIAMEEFLSYSDKYISKGKTTKGMVATNRIMPARIDKKLYDEVDNLAKKVFRVLNLSGVVRIDFLIDKKANIVYVNEPNIIPGSLSFYLWVKKNKTYSVLLDELISFAIKEYKNKKAKITSFESNILENCNNLKGLKK